MYQTDILIAGAGAAGLPAAIIASQRGANVLVVDAADQIGGTFHLSNGQMSAANSRLQQAKGITDSPEAHFEDVMRINGDTADPALVRLAVENAADTLDWLMDLGFAPLPEHPVIYPGHEPYRTPRTCWGSNNGLSVLATLKPAFQAGIDAGRITLWLKSELVGLERDSAGRVTGASVRKDGERIPVQSGSVVLATGGFTANAALFEKLTHGRPLYSGGYRHSQGGGLMAALQAGGITRNEGMYLPIFAAVSDPRASGGYIAGTLTNPLIREPWEIFVDETGVRFFAEDQKSCDVREHALEQRPGLRFWVLYDEAVREQAPPFFLDASLQERFGRDGDYLKADTLEDLAVQAGMDVDSLVRTVNTYNAAIAEGTPDPLGRVHRPLPIARAPFYAVRHFGWSILSFPGLAVDDQLRVIDQNGAPIENLYAAGEILGFAATGGAAFTSGMSVTPALTFGRLLGDMLGTKADAMAGA